MEVELSRKRRRVWSESEDRTLVEYIKVHGPGHWPSLAKDAGLKRSGKSCRLRWMNYLRPNIKHGSISSDEEQLIIRLHSLLGNRWSLIAGRIPGRTDNEIKNYWNKYLSKNKPLSLCKPEDRGTTKLSEFRGESSLDIQKATLISSDCHEKCESKEFGEIWNGLVCGDYANALDVFQGINMLEDEHKCMGVTMDDLSLWSSIEEYNYCSPGEKLSWRCGWSPLL